MKNSHELLFNFAEKFLANIHFPPIAKKLEMVTMVIACSKCVFAKRGKVMANDVASFAKQLINLSLNQKATDIHFHPAVQKQHVQIYFRILGKRKFVRDISLSFYEMLLTYFKFEANMDIGETRKPQDGMIHWLVDDGNKMVDLRLSTLPANLLESLTIRIFPQEEPFKLHELFLFPFQLKQMKKWLLKQNGLILFTGPTGSGKSTMMYALLEKMIDMKPVQVITLEEPIERKIDSIIQVEINERAGLTYQIGLKAALRHDPDVILIGEIRDEKTAKFAFRAALTGHLVLSTLHAKDAIGTIERLKDLGISQQELHQSLIAVAALELLPIIVKGEVTRRAAIVEMLEGHPLEKIITGKTISENEIITFQKLKEKAVCYGFVRETNVKTHT